MTELEEKAPTIDELEAIMLADYEGLYHKDAARKMETFRRILRDTHRKVAGCLLKGKALKIEILQ